MNERGRLCEELVAQYLASENYEIMARNYRCRGGEIDIIARKDSVLCFVEVKSLSGRWTQDQLARMVDGKKRKCIQLTAIDYLNKVYMQSRQLEGQNKVQLEGQFELRFDVASVTGTNVAYYKGVF